MSNEEFFRSYFCEITNSIEIVDHSVLRNIASKIRSVGSSGGKVIIAGNGGSAAMASHVSVDLTKTACIRSTNFNEADLITCFSNDYGYENWLAKAIQVYADPNDIAILISSSGQSTNMVNAADQVRGMKIPLVTLTGFKPNNPLRGKGDVNLWVGSTSYNVVEMAHHIWLLSIVDYLVERDK